MKKYDIAIIGGGVLGNTISYWLSTLYDLNICVIDKEKDVAVHSSTRNSGVIHYPFYLNSKTKKNFVRAAFLSHELWKSLAKENKIPWVQGVSDPTDYNTYIKSMNTRLAEILRTN